MKVSESYLCENVLKREGVALERFRAKTGATRLAKAARDDEESMDCSTRDRRV